MLPCMSVLGRLPRIIPLFVSREGSEKCGHIVGAIRSIGTSRVYPLRGVFNVFDCIG